jgi:hypothetical protein
MAGVLEPLMAELSLSRQQLVSQAEAIGRLGAELDAERRAHSPVAGQQTPQPVEPTAVWTPGCPACEPWRRGCYSRQ